MAFSYATAASDRGDGKPESVTSSECTSFLHKQKKPEQLPTARGTSFATLTRNGPLPEELVALLRQLNYDFVTELVVELKSAEVQPWCPCGLRHHAHNFGARDEARRDTGQFFLVATHCVAHNDGDMPPILEQFAHGPEDTARTAHLDEVSNCPETGGRDDFKKIHGAVSLSPWSQRFITRCQHSREKFPSFKCTNSFLAAHLKERPTKPMSASQPVGGLYRGPPPRPSATRTAKVGPRLDLDPPRMSEDLRLPRAPVREHRLDTLARRERIQRANARCLQCPLPSGHEERRGADHGGGSASNRGHRRELASAASQLRPVGGGIERKQLAHGWLVSRLNDAGGDLLRRSHALGEI